MTTNVLDSENGSPITNAESCESMENNFYRQILSCSKLLALRAQDIFGEDFQEDNICSFIRREDWCKDFLVIDNWMVYLLPFTQTNERNRMQNHADMWEVLEKYRLSAAGKKYISQNQLYEYLMGNIINDYWKLEMKSIYKVEKKVYEHIERNKSKTMENFKRIWEISWIKNDYPFDRSISMCVNWIEYTSQFHPKKKFYYDSVTDFIWEPLTDSKNIWKYYSNSWVMAFVNSNWEIYIVKYSKENEQVLLDCWYKEQAMRVPFSSWTEDFFGFNTFNRQSNPEAFV
ncbi:MAG: hypothetical protein ACD_2C00091G0001 [uncultured bacterium (gcode 4)]|uniref:Uncharacterized protein n=1 Tax=uncultured bacterium (gcode 4) TaxID=1234023 RepID=K2H1U1_9BACT|nr:MAG: hypothetical protein ACD_2C00091G0001 [uncultured bacterium (gcode 4)]